MKILFLGASYADPDKRSSDAVKRDSERVDEMVRLGHEVRCISLVTCIPPHPWWMKANMGDASLQDYIEGAFPGMCFDMAIVDYVWLPVSVTWITESGYLCNNAQITKTMKKMGVPLWIVDNAATSSVIRGERCTWANAVAELPLLQAEDNLGSLVAKDLKSNRRAHKGWFILK